MRASILIWRPVVTYLSGSAAAGLLLRPLLQQLATSRLQPTLESSLADLMNINEVYRRRCRQEAKTGLRL